MLEPKKYEPTAKPVQAIQFDDETGNVEAILNWVSFFEDCDIDYIPEDYRAGYTTSPHLELQPHEEDSDLLVVFLDEWLLRDVDGKYFKLDTDDFLIEFKGVEA